MPYTLVRGAVAVAVPDAEPAVDPRLVATTWADRDRAWREFACDRRVAWCLLGFGCLQALAVWGLFAWAVGTVV
jgi:hypothetical protein